MRTVFDINVLIRACLGSARINALLGMVAEKGCILLINQLLVDEFANTARKPRLPQKIDWPAYNDVLGLLTTVGEVVGVAPPFPACRDQDDRYLLGIAVEGNADYLATSDQDLLTMGSIKACRIVTPEEFETILAAE